jgi:hypothetical protein
MSATKLFFTTKMEAFRLLPERFFVWRWLYDLLNFSVKICAKSHRLKD